MKIKDFDKQFVERTKEIVIRAFNNNDCEYEVTLLLNCMLGLVSLPIERTPVAGTIFENACKAKMKELGVIIQNDCDARLFRAIRNALSHLRISPGNRDGEIEKIILEDRLPMKSNPHTILEFSVSQLKEFVIFVADKHLERIDSERKVGCQ